MTKIKRSISTWRPGLQGERVIIDLKEYAPGDRVHVGDSIEAVIESTTVAKGTDGELFINWVRVVWWADGIRQCQELSPWEVRPVQNGCIGFPEAPV